jgi:phage shock protein C
MEKKLTRSRSKKVIAGIAGGLGEYLNIDPIIIRIIIVLITIFHGIGLLIYIIMWIVIPEEPYSDFFTENKFEEPSDIGQNIKEEASKVADEIKMQSKSSNGRIIFGVILILIGAIFLFERFFPFFDFEFVFGFGMVILGIALLFNFFNKSEKS